MLDTGRAALSTILLDFRNPASPSGTAVGSRHYRPLVGVLPLAPLEQFVPLAAAAGSDL